MNQTTIPDEEKKCFQYKGLVYIPAVDRNDLSLRKLFPQFEYAQGNFVCESFFDQFDELISLWSCDIAFKNEVDDKQTSRLNLITEYAKEAFKVNIKYEKGFSGHRRALFSEFSSNNNLNPIRVLVTGGPKFGKTTCAKLIASK
jgi:hypothetical protein